jgi:hypothetical protein
MSKPASVCIMKSCTCLLYVQLCEASVSQTFGNRGPLHRRSPHTRTIIVIIIINDSTVLVRTLAASHTEVL